MVQSQFFTVVEPVLTALSFLFFWLLPVGTTCQRVLLKPIGMKEKLDAFLVLSMEKHCQVLIKSKEATASTLQSQAFTSFPYCFKESAERLLAADL